MRECGVAEREARGTGSRCAGGMRYILGYMRGCAGGCEARGAGNGERVRGAGCAGGSG